MKQDYFILSTESNIFPEFDPVKNKFPPLLLIDLDRETKLSNLLINIFN